MLGDPMLCIATDANGGPIFYNPALEPAPASGEIDNLMIGGEIRTEDLAMCCAEDSQFLNKFIDGFSECVDHPSQRHIHNMLPDQEAHDVDELNLPKEECKVNWLKIVDNPSERQIHNVLPDREEHDNGGLMFTLNIPPENSKVNWFFSEKFNRVYIKPNEIINFEIAYYPRSENEELFVRIMMVFNTEVSEPVIRCENHSSKDTETQKNIKHSVLRCENPNATYQGTLDGKNISDRLSVQISLGGLRANERNLAKQTVALKFSCQNSCVGRRDTSLIFYIENANGEILSKRVIGLKVCSCPKRDKNKDEGKSRDERRDECPVGKKILRLDNDLKIEVKRESIDEEVNDVTVTPNGVKVTLFLPNNEAASYVVQSAYNKLAGQILSNPNNPSLECYLKKLEKEIPYTKFNN